MKYLITIIIVFQSFFGFSTADRTREWIFEYFNYSITKNFGHDQYWEEDYSIKYTFSAKANKYVKMLINKGLLEDKPIIVSSNYWHDNKNYIEIYQGKRAYYINLFNNYEPDIIKIIVYLSSNKYTPIFSMHKWKEICKTISENDFCKTTENFVLYTDSTLQIRYKANKFVLFSNDNFVLDLSPPFTFPLKFENKYILIDQKHVYIVENKKIIKEIVFNKSKYYSIFGANMQWETNPKIKVYNKWINIISDEGVVVSYNIKKNQVFIL